MDNSKKIFICLLTLIIIQLSIIVMFINNKSGYFVDEQLTFGFASNNEPYLYPYEVNSETIVPPLKLHTNLWIDRKYFHDYLTIQEEDRFNYNQIYNNHKHDSHPPLYTFIINLICSFFPNQFNPWCGYVVNLVAFVIVQILIFNISKNFFASNIAWLPCFFYGFTLASVNTYLYLRMYALVTVFYLFSIYLHIKYLKKHSSRLLFLMYLCSLLGFLTNNHFYIFHFFLSISMCVFLYKKTGLKSMFKYGFTIIFSVVTAFLYFPSAIFQMFCYERGQEAVNAINRILLPDNAYLFIDIILKYIVGCPKLFINFATNAISFLYGIILFIICPFLVIMHKFKLFSNFKCIQNKNKLFYFDIFTYDTYKYIIIIFPIICFIQIITPMVEFMRYCIERWYFPIIPFFIIFFVKAMYEILYLTFKAKNTILFVIPLLMIFSFCSYSNNTEEYTVSKTFEINREKLKKDLINANCIIFLTYDPIIHSFCDLLLNCKKAYVTRPYAIDLLKLKNNLQHISDENNLLIIIPENITLEFDKKVDIPFVLDFIKQETNYFPVFKYTAINHIEPYKVYKLVKK